MLEPLLVAYQKTIKWHEAIYKSLVKARHKIEKTGQNDSVDAAYLCKQLVEFSDDIRKEAQALQHTLNRVVCLRWVTTGLNTGATGPIRGQFTAGSPKMRQATTLPKRDTPEWHEMMRFFNITGEAKNVTDVSWPRLSQYITDLAEKGQPLPDGLSKQYTIYGVSLRATAEVPSPKGYRWRSRYPMNNAS